MIYKLKSLKSFAFKPLAADPAAPWCSNCGARTQSECTCDVYDARRKKPLA
jgi:hypothetical protein